jgi:hypothetical protein
LSTSTFWTACLEMIVLAGVDSVGCHGWWCWKDEFFGIYGRKNTCKIVSTLTLKLVFERDNKECEIGGAYSSYLGIDVWMLI